MRYEILLKAEAEQDLKIAYDWYEEQRQGLGNIFIEKIDSAFDRIIRNPRSFQKRYKEVRMCFTNEFPFGIHYLVDANKIIVIAILHTSRNPIDWK